MVNDEDEQAATEDNTRLPDMVNDEDEQAAAEDDTRFRHTFALVPGVAEGSPYFALV